MAVAILYGSGKYTAQNVGKIAAPVLLGTLAVSTTSSTDTISGFYNYSWCILLVRGSTYTYTQSNMFPTSLIAGCNISANRTSSGNTVRDITITFTQSGTDASVTHKLSGGSGWYVDIYGIA